VWVLSFASTTAIGILGLVIKNVICAFLLATTVALAMDQNFAFREREFFSNLHVAIPAFDELVKVVMENFKLCRKTVGKFHVMPDKNFI
jgi:hypothetical protein